MSSTNMIALQIDFVMTRQTMVNKYTLRIQYEIANIFYIKYLLNLAFGKNKN